VKQEENSIKSPAKKTVTFDLGMPPASPESRKSPKRSILKKKTASHDATSLLQQRPYLKKSLPTPPAIPPQTSTPTSPPEHERAITWGKTLGSINNGTIDELAK